MAKNKTEQKAVETTENATESKETVFQNAIRVHKLSQKAINDLKATSGKYFGKVKSSEMKESVHGESFCFYGVFQAEIQIGEETAILKSDKLYVPSLVEGDILEALAVLDEGEELVIAIEIIKKPDEKSGRGYVWEYKHLLPITAKDPFAEIKALMG